MRALLRSRPGGGTFHIEDVQDHVELSLMRGGHHEVARAYVLYRERRSQERAKQAKTEAKPAASAMMVTDELFEARADIDDLLSEGTDKLKALAESVKGMRGAEPSELPRKAAT